MDTVTVIDPHGVRVEVPTDRVYLYARLGWDTPTADTPEKTPRQSKRSTRKEA